MVQLLGNLYTQHYIRMVAVYDCLLMMVLKKEMVMENDR